jgi:hypothetical protein
MNRHNSLRCQDFGRAIRFRPLFPPGTNFPPSGRSPGRLRPLPPKTAFRRKAERGARARPRLAAKPTSPYLAFGGSLPSGMSFFHC